MSSRHRAPGAVWLGLVTGAAAMVAGCSSTSGSGSSSSPAAAATVAAVATVADAPTTTADPTAGTVPGVVTTNVGNTSAAAAAGTPSSASAAPAPAVAADPAATLQQALTALGTTYHFSSTASVNGAVALVADGDRIGDGSRLSVTANEATVGYVITADGTWVHQPGAAWQQIDDPPATADPIEALRAPSGVVLVGTDADGTKLDIIVPGTALGLAGDSGVTVRATVVDGALGSVSYTAMIGTTPATVIATFGPAADPSPVAAPA
ncbi:MAG: hypothetical protein JWM12_2088 [Ilumatobacteraceae bacterium]|nr:hypothetical protein [Ilumatobacteraceae bacterium]